MEDQKDGNLIQGFDGNDNIFDSINNYDYKKLARTKRRNRYLLLSGIIIVIVAIIVLVLVFIVFRKKSNTEPEPQPQPQPQPEPDPEEKTDPKNEIDTISNEEMNKARNAFKQYKYTDTINNSYILDYNLFIPDNYISNKKYPLIIFIEDASFVGNNSIKSPLDGTVGGPIWATDTEQKKHECFVLVPHYNERIIDDNNNQFYVSEYINVTVRLIQKLINDYSINKDRIYSTGQSMGAMTTLYLLSNYQNLLSAGLIIDGQWKLDELKGLINSTFTYFAAEGDEKAFKGQTEVKQYFNSLNTSYGELNDVNAQDKVETLNEMANTMYEVNFSYNFITYKNGSVFPEGVKKTNEHMASFKYGYRIDKVRDWIFKQNKIKCKEGTYYSEDSKCSNINYCKITKKDLNCKECIYEYYLSSDGESCTKDKNCLNGDKDKGICNYCNINYYLDLQDNQCKNNTIDEKYKYCKIVDNGKCIDCEVGYFLSDDDKCTITPNCSISNNSLCTKCQEDFYLGLDHRCSSIEKCIYSYQGICNECQDGYYLNVNEDKCIESKDNFTNCKKNDYYSPEKCELCKNNFYISYKDYLCYNNTEQGPFYKCQIGNFLGDKCINCVDGYYIGKKDSNCSKIKGCLQSLDENTCSECDDYYCLDNKGNCSDNHYVIDENKKYYYRCKVLNEDGTKCKICENNLNITNEGICYDNEHCESYQYEKCVKCQKDNLYGYYGYCLNDIFGCIDTFLEHCIKCNDIKNIDTCTQCEEGYEINEYGKCIKIE